MVPECKSSDTVSSDVSKRRHKWSSKSLSEKVKESSQLGKERKLTEVAKIYGKKESSIRDIAEK